MACSACDIVVARNYLMVLAWSWFSWLIVLLELIEAGEEFAHADIPGGYREIDTQEDFELARKNWPDN